MKMVYFGYGIVEINNQQERYLKLLYELTILWKLHLSEKFPYCILYARKDTLGIRLIIPNTVLHILATKLYIRHGRASNNISRIINTIDKKMFLEKRYNEIILEESAINNNIGVWNEYVSNALH